MNRLQKKCVIATAGFHLLLLVILFVGPAFFNQKQNPDDSHVVDVIPADLVDALINSGVQHATPPPTPPTPPTPPVTPSPQPAPSEPQPVVQPTTTPTIVDRVKTFFKPEPPKPPTKPVETQPQTPKVNLNLVSREAPKNPTPVKPIDNNVRAINNTLRNLRANLSKPTVVGTSGDSSTAVANYASVVKSVYDQAWRLPDSVANDEENVRVSVTIARDGRVIIARILEKSGDGSVDNSVQRTLDRVQFIAAFPEGSTDNERTYTINFNPKAKRMLE